MDRIRNLEETIFPLLAPTLAAVLRRVPKSMLEAATEIRLRIDQPLLLVAQAGDSALGTDGHKVNNLREAYICRREEIAQSMQLISRNSLYAFEQELRMGFFTVIGGHRIGLVGQAIMHDGQIKALKNIGSLNIRLARQLPGVADKIMPYLIAGERRVYSTLFIGPPRTGKTTLLRDVARQLSSGIPRLNFTGVQLGLVDERSEIAACQDGVPTVDLGPRADVLDGCPKATGMLMLIRSMGPAVVISDELGREDDAIAVKEALHAGVSVIASVHGCSMEDIGRRPYVGDLVRQKMFERYVVIGDNPVIGTIEAIIGTSGEVLYSFKKEVRECG